MRQAADSQAVDEGSNNLQRCGTRCEPFDMELLEKALYEKLSPLRVLSKFNIKTDALSVRGYVRFENAEHQICFAIECATGERARLVMRMSRGNSEGSSAPSDWFNTNDELQAAIEQCLNQLRPGFAALIKDLAAKS